MAKEKIWLTRHTLGSLISGSFSLIKLTWRKALPISVLLYLPAALLSALTTEWWAASSASLYRKNMSQLADNSWSNYDFLIVFLGLFSLMLLSYFIQIFLNAFSSAALARNAWSALSGEGLGWKAVLRETFRKKAGKILAMCSLLCFLILGGIIIFSLCVGIIVYFVESRVPLAIPAVLFTGVVGLALVIAGFILGNFFSFSAAVIGIEDVGPVQALKASFRLVKGDSWRVLGINCLMVAAVEIVMFVLALPFAFLDGRIKSILHLSWVSYLLGGFILAIGSSITRIAFGLFSPLCRTLFYVDQKIRVGDLADTADYSGLDGAMGDKSIH